MTTRHNNRPTNIFDESDLTTLYNRLSLLVRLIPKQNVLIGRDMNAQIGKDEN